jgi:hypothetical protein
MSLAHRSERAVADLIGYEAELNRIMSNFPQVNPCLYDLTRCTGDLIMNVLKTHPKALLRISFRHAAASAPDAQAGPP